MSWSAVGGGGFSLLWVEPPLKGGPGLCKKAGQASHKMQGSQQNSSTTSASVMVPLFLLWIPTLALPDDEPYAMQMLSSTNYFWPFFLNHSNRKQTEIKVCTRFMGYCCDSHGHILGWMVEWLWNVWQAQTLSSQSLMTCCCESLTDRNAERDADDGELA